jgi:hypothetical protein
MGMVHGSWGWFERTSGNHGNFWEFLQRIWGSTLKMVPLTCSVAQPQVDLSTQNLGWSGLNLGTPKIGLFYSTTRNGFKSSLGVRFFGSSRMRLFGCLCIQKIMKSLYRAFWIVTWLVAKYLLKSFSTNLYKSHCCFAKWFVRFGICIYLQSASQKHIATFHQEACRSRILGAQSHWSDPYLLRTKQAVFTRHLSEDFALTVSYSKTCPRPQPAVASFAAQATVRGAFMNQYTVYEAIDLMRFKCCVKPVVCWSLAHIILIVQSPRLCTIQSFVCRPFPGFAWQGLTENTASLILKSHRWSADRHVPIKYYIYRYILIIWDLWDILIYYTVDIWEYTNHYIYYTEILYRKLP